jgi:DNA adenine methylase
MTSSVLQQNLFEAPDAQAFKPVNIASVPHRSPFRYAGGKTWLIPEIRKWLSALPEKPTLLIEPFAGGGIVSLTAAFESLADRVLMVELDNEVAAVWETIVGNDAEWLAKRIEMFEMSLDSAKEIVTSSPTYMREIAFRTIVKNRTFHGGILASGSTFLKHGENGRGVLSRWYPRTLARRIRDIDYVRKRIEFVRGDAFEIIKQYSKQKSVAWFVDPPYTAGGKRAGSRLYTHSQIDHKKLFSLMEGVQGSILITYDNADEVKALAERHGFETALIPMKNTHHAKMAELLIGNDLSWVDGLRPREENRVNGN